MQINQEKFIQALNKLELSTGDFALVISALFNSEIVQHQTQKINIENPSKLFDNGVYIYAAPNGSPFLDGYVTTSDTSTGDKP